jgi:hypothetical protein
VRAAVRSSGSVELGAQEGEKKPRRKKKALRKSPPPVGARGHVTAIRRDAKIIFASFTVSTSEGFF